MRGVKEPTRGGEKLIKGRKKQKKITEKRDRGKRRKEKGGMIASDAYRAPKQRGAKEQKDLERKALGFFYFFQRDKIF